MQNIFPLAQKAVIEQTIGTSRPSATPPEGQNVKESSFVHSKMSLFDVLPKWFKDEEISEIEKIFILKINRKLFLEVVNTIKVEELTYNKTVDLEYNKLTNQNSDSKEDTLNKDIAKYYLKVRNSIIEMYRKSQGYIPFNSILTFQGFNYKVSAKIFDFLEDSKIINYQTNLCAILSDLDGILNDEDPAQPEQLETSKDNINTTRLDLLANSIVAVQPESSNDVKIKEKYFKKETLENSQCTCGRKAQYFTSDLVFVCETCFESNKYPAGYSSRNFHKITDSLLKSMWTKQEEYILLKNIERVGDDWSRVCEGLNKSVDQCIFHFIKMSIIDECNLFPSMPFTQVPNPISTLVAFVCSMVYPSISTELAKNAIRYLNSPNLMEILLEVSKEKSMEVLDMEKKKLQKLENVEIEAKMKRVMLKIDSINEMYAEVQAVRSELEDQRERLIEESIRSE
ncbi:uncharacterized protein VICG_01988 [Vittaforma corneae ATCC 50505]|uniref:Uncharacterized protein n=1 Tax=Vittaforma corneae (strain ATCC 50505) TaxID=993615 RepID=L2GJA2_VITCO|nr:uncharacterized protein VICG_01988 [Vittaforma corneae ATCC 50505]ELA40958.1 hypothetical protein VICG_01988 [Vittaforma corneae ATCC 50505]